MNRLGFLCLLLLLQGCASPSQQWSHRSFAFYQDTMAYPNELLWRYQVDPITGEQTHFRKDPPPSYVNHCFVVARSVRQFFQSAQFDPGFPKVSEENYRSLIRKVVRTNPRRPASRKILIPGFADLRQFSEAYEKLLKEECGGAWQSYFQRGNWRMIFPFSRRHQETAANRFISSLNQNRPPVAHIVDFPGLAINHAVVIFDYSESPDEICFSIYDPNRPEGPATLLYNKLKRSFHFDQNFYFKGGSVSVYEHYSSAIY